MAIFSRVQVGVDIDGRGFNSGLAGMTGQFNKFASGIKGQLLSVFSIAFLTRMIRETALWGSKISDLAVEVGLSTKEMQAFDIAAKKTGTSLEMVTTALGVLAKNRNDAMRGVKQKSDAFDTIFGFKGNEGAKKTQRDTLMKGSGMGELLLEIGDQFGEKDFGAATAGLLKEVLGRNGPRFLVAFKEGFGNIFRLVEKSGAIVPDETIQKLDTMVDKWWILVATLRAPFAEAMVKVMDYLNGSLEIIRFGVDVIAEMIKGINASGGIKVFFKEALDEFAIKAQLGFLEIKEAAIKTNTFLSREEKGSKMSAIHDERRALNQLLTEQGPGVVEQMVAGFKAGFEVATVKEHERFGLIDAIEKFKLKTKGMQDDVDTPLERTKTKETADSLAKIGGFVGASSRMLTVQEQQLKTQKATKDLLEKGIKIKGEL